MRIDRRLLNWGLFLVALGGLPLAVRFGVLPDTVHWFDLWPLVLVGIGLGVLLQATRLAVLGGAVVAITLGALIGGTVANGAGVAFGCARDGRAFPSAGGNLGDRASVELELACGQLDVKPVSGQAWTVSGTSDDGQAPTIDSSTDRLSVRSSESGGPFNFGGGGSLAVRLPASPTLDLSATVNAGEARLNLVETHLQNVSLTVNAGSVTVDLTRSAPGKLGATVNAGSLKVQLPGASLGGNLTVNAGSMRLCLPAGTGLRIETGGGVLGGYEFGGAGLVQSGNVWTTPGFEAAASRIDLTATANAGSISLNPSEGCA
jgi:hypothetical protein